MGRFAQAWTGRVTPGDRPQCPQIRAEVFEDNSAYGSLPAQSQGVEKEGPIFPCMEQNRPLQSFSDDELLRRLSELLWQSRRAESDLVAHIAEVDERRLYVREASPSMFAYCTEVLHLSEAEAYLRIAAARASREHPMLLAMLGDGRLHLTGIAKLAPHLTVENRAALLERATHRSKRQIEDLIAELAPSPDAPSVVRKLPQRRTLLAAERPLGAESAASPMGELRPDAVASPVPAPVRPAEVQPLAPARYKVQFTASADLRNKLERLRALLRSEVPDGDLASIIEQAVTEKLERLEARRFAGDQGSAEAAFGLRHRSFLAPHPGRRPAGRVRARWRPMSLRGRARPTVLRARSARVSSPPTLCLWRGPWSAEHSLDVPGPQRVPGRARLRSEGDGPAPSFGEPCRRGWPCSRQSALRLDAWRSALSHFGSDVGLTVATRRPGAVSPWDVARATWDGDRGAMDRVLWVLTPRRLRRKQE